MAFKSENNYTLYYLNRDPEILKEINYISDETRLLIHSKSLSGEKAIIICSEQLTLDENWINLPNENLMVADRNLKLSIVEI